MARRNAAPPPASLHAIRAGQTGRAARAERRTSAGRRPPLHLADGLPRRIAGLRLPGLPVPARLTVAVGVCSLLVAAALAGLAGLSPSASASPGGQSPPPALSIPGLPPLQLPPLQLPDLSQLLNPSPPPPAMPPPGTAPGPEPKPAPAGGVPATSVVADAVVSSVPVYGSPAVGPVLWRVAGTNSVGQAEAFLVKNQAPGWFQVEVPVKPNGSLGWIQASSVSTRVDPYYIKVDQSQYQLQLYQDGQLRDTFKVAIGAPSTPTPNGSFFVWAAQDWNAAPYAVGIFALSGFSPVLDNWPGGGRAGIHGWRDTSVMGTQASHGCVRMAPSDFARLIHTVPLGTPVDIQQ